jgi:hypothetical protein
MSSVPFVGLVFLSIRSLLTFFMRLNILVLFLLSLVFFHVVSPARKQRNF